MKQVCWMSQPFLSQTPLNRSAPKSPQSVPMHRNPCLLASQACTVKAMEILFASHKSISVQHVPYLPLPAFSFVSDGTQTLNVGTAMGPLHVVGALSITVASPILGTSHVTVLGVLALATIIVHLYEVHGPIEPQSISASSTVKVNSRCFMWNIL